MIVPEDTPPLLSRILYEREVSVSPPSVFPCFGPTNTLPFMGHKQGPLFTSLVEVQNQGRSFNFMTPVFKFGDTAQRKEFKPTDNVASVM